MFLYFTIVCIFFSLYLIFFIIIIKVVEHFIRSASKYEILTYTKAAFHFSSQTFTLAKIYWNAVLLILNQCSYGNSVRFVSWGCFASMLSASCGTWNLGFLLGVTSLWEKQNKHSLFPSVSMALRFPVWSLLHLTCPEWQHEGCWGLACSHGNR